MKDQNRVVLPPPEDNFPSEPDLHQYKDLTLFSRQEYDFAGKQVVLMSDANTQAMYMVAVDQIDLTSPDPQRVDVAVAFQPYDWQAELEAIVPDAETVRRIFLESFWRAGAFDRSALETGIRNGMFDTAFPFKRNFLNLLGE